MQALRDAAPAALVTLVLACVLFLVNGARLAWIDARTHMLPNRIIVPWYPFAVVLLLATAALAGDWEGLGRVLLAGLTLFGFYLLLHVIQPRGMGLGDVKLAGILGLYLGYLGWPHVLLGTLLAFLLGAVVGLVLISLRRAGLKSALAFGPYMIAGTATALLVAG